MAFRTAASSENMQSMNPFLDWIAGFGSRHSENNELHEAIRCNTKNVATLLLALGADIDAVDHKDRTALWVSMKKRRDSMALFLIDRGANVNTTEYIGKSLVHIYVQLRDNQHQGGKVLQALLSRGANPNFRSQSS